MVYYVFLIRVTNIINKIHMNIRIIRIHLA